MYQDATKQHKNAVPVRVTPLGEAPFDGLAFLALNQRLTDLLNDDRAFIPIQKLNGDTAIIAKRQIVSIIEAGSESGENEPTEPASDDPLFLGGEAETEPPQDETDQTHEDAPSSMKSGARFDAYAFLGVARDATLGDIRDVYKKKIKAAHPDRLAGQNASEAAYSAALKLSQKINHAYRQIMRERGSS